MSAVRLTWDGKDSTVRKLQLPLQVVEIINSPKADRGTLFQGGDSDEGWRNQLIWGDNEHVLASLVSKYAGQVNLIYIDPPFDSRQDYTVEVGVGVEGVDESYAKIQSVIEEKAYRDTWGAGRSSYLQMLLTRLILCRELLSNDGSIVVHMDWHQGHYAKVLLDEVFGESNFRNEIVWWYYNKYQGNINRFASNHDVLLWYSKSDKFKFNKQKELRAKPEQQLVRVWDPATKKLVNAKDPETGKVMYQESTERTVDDVWRISMLQPADKTENVRYETQKPLALVERVVSALSEKGDLVLDCFVGSGTTAVAAERLSRRWLAVDIGRFAIHTTRKRLLEIPGCTPFSVANLGRYERQVWQSDRAGSDYSAYLDFICRLYGAEPVSNFVSVHGETDRRAVHVGAVDAPISAQEVQDALDEAKTARYGAVDVLGWEFELGLHDAIEDEARSRGMTLTLRRIPLEVMDPRAVADGTVTFHELAFVQVEATVARRIVTVSLTDFVLPNVDLIPDSVRSAVTHWSDYIDYWALDFTHGSPGVEGDTFRNQWQSYRTRKDRALELAAEHTYEDAGSYSILVKVVDIFGNDTTVSVPVEVS